ncbi:MAG: calcium-binding protein, partial [Alphaproteobacteria bacterium]|nr:calcium-binding protein [Alphaproteobacteria bacterium]
TDFESGTGGDILDLQHVAAISSFEDVMANTSQDGDDTVIDLGEGDIITLSGVDMTSLQENDFLI